MITVVDFKGWVWHLRFAEYQWKSNEIWLWVFSPGPPELLEYELIPVPLFRDWWPDD